MPCWRRAAGEEAADANVSETARTQRQIIRDCLSGKGRDKAEGWCRATWRFRRRLYDGAKSIQAAETWGAISQLFATS
jgi:ParB family chromosome partitioning protein